jgi:hypothetical protein
MLTVNQLHLRRRRRQDTQGIHTKEGQASLCLWE